MNQTLRRWEYENETFRPWEYRTSKLLRKERGARKSTSLSKNRNPLKTLSTGFTTIIHFSFPWRYPTLFAWSKKKLIAVRRKIRILWFNYNYCSRREADRLHKSIDPHNGCELILKFKIWVESSRSIQVKSIQIIFK